MALGEVSVDPVGNVQCPVDAQGKEIMRGDCLGLACSLQHEELRQNGHAFQPDRERPQDLGDGPFVGEQDGEHGGTARQVGNAEGVEVGIVRGLVIVQHHVERIGGGCEEDDLEDGVPRAVGECPKQICRWSLEVRRGT